jgi:hypothetical protein
MYLAISSLSRHFKKVPLEIDGCSSDSSSNLRQSWSQHGWPFSYLYNRTFVPSGQ